MNHLSSSTWLQEIMNRTTWQTERMISVLKSSKCLNQNLFDQVPIRLAAEIASLQISGEYTKIFGPILDHYLSGCPKADRKNRALKYKTNEKICSLMLKACFQMNVDCPQFMLGRNHAKKSLSISTTEQSIFDIGRARPYFGKPGGSSFGKPIPTRRPLKKKPAFQLDYNYYKKEKGGFGQGKTQKKGKTFF
jgi:hypothetical protein